MRSGTSSDITTHHTSKSTTESLYAEARAAGIEFVTGVDGVVSVRFSGDRPAEILARMKPHRHALLILAAGRVPDLCFGCSAAPVAATPFTQGLATECGFGDCPHRVGPPPSPAAG